MGDARSYQRSGVDRDVGGAASGVVRLIGYHEDAHVFDCEGSRLLGIVCRPASGFAAKAGVVIVVGGPQYRVGSHRHFALMARSLARSGVASIRFDLRGMGDSEGTHPGYECTVPDIAKAVEALLAAQPDVRSVVLWGLCDGASAAVLAAPEIPSVSGLILLNPWVRTEATEARVLLRHYYRSRLISGAFWRNLLTGKVRVLRSLSAALTVGSSAARSQTASSDETAPHDRLLDVLEALGLPVGIILSANDLVAREFEDAVLGSKRWAALHERCVLGVYRAPMATHVFSSEQDRRQTERWTEELLRKMAVYDESDER